MKNILCAATAAAVGAFALTACDVEPPADTAITPPAETAAVPPAETATEVIREKLDEIVRDPDVYARTRRLATLVPTLGPEAVPAVVEILDDPTFVLRDIEIGLLVRYWAAHQPEEATHWAANVSSLTYREGAVFAALSAWAAVDPRAAVNTSLPWTMEEPMYQRIVPIAVVRGWHAGGDTAGLEEWMRSLDPSTFRQVAITTYVRILVEQQGMEAAMRWAESRPEDAQGESYKLDAFRRTVHVLASIDIPTVARWCDIHCYGPYGKNMRSIIARKWVWHGDGAESMAWLKDTRPGIERNHAVRHAYALWTREDPDAALAWFADQAAAGDTEWLQTVYPVVARLLAPKDPAEAMKWAARIPNEAESEMFMIGVARVWRGVDEAAAEAWLEQSPLSEEAREKARTLAKRVPSLPAPGQGDG